MLALVAADAARAISPAVSAHLAAAGAHAVAVAPVVLMRLLGAAAISACTILLPVVSLGLLASFDVASLLIIAAGAAIVVDHVKAARMRAISIVHDLLVFLSASLECKFRMRTRHFSGCRFCQGADRRRRKCRHQQQSAQHSLFHFPQPPSVPKNVNRVQVIYQEGL